MRCFPAPAKISFRIEGMMILFCLFLWFPIKPDSMKTRKKAVFNWSGGKDSALALHRAIASGEYEIISLLTTVNRGTGRSSMHAIPEKILHAQSESIGIPLKIVYLSDNGEMIDYEQAMSGAVIGFKELGATHFIFGDIFLHDVRSYREKQLAPHGLEVVEPLWDMGVSQVMEEFLASGLHTVVVTTMADLLGREFIGRTIDSSFVADLPSGVDVCGENGEYHTLCYDGPIFRHPVMFSLGEPFLFSHEVGMEDGSRQTFSYWFANIDG